MALGQQQLNKILKADERFEDVCEFCEDRFIVWSNVGWTVFGEGAHCTSFLCTWESGYERTEETRKDILDELDNFYPTPNDK
jgi:hypothetical protein